MEKTFEDKKIHTSEETVRLSNGETAQMVVYSAKKDVLKNQRVFPNEIVDRAVALLLDKASAMDIELEIQTNPALPSVRLDPSSISRIFPLFAFQAWGTSWVSVLTSGVMKNTSMSMSIMRSLWTEKNFWKGLR